MSINFNDSKMMILIWKIKNVQINQKSSKIPNCNHCWIKTQTLEELDEPLNGMLTVSDRVYTQWERFKKKANEFHMNCLNWLFKIV